ncbi:hypothetical protein SDC9_189018 [bioreactor metagenome]|uniref:Uncharacterized protein n=1 Tax=bioreactor metagenome TaxID=1076179 RepID=A0A645HSL8_9ZZZZ
MAGIERKVLEFVRFIDVKVVYTHVFEIDCIILTVFDGVHNRLQLGFQIEFTPYATFQHGTGNFFALVFEYLQIFLHAVEFGL